jgi:hypothetical protein
MVELVRAGRSPSRLLKKSVSRAARSIGAMMGVVDNGFCG